MFSSAQPHFSSGRYGGWYMSNIAAKTPVVLMLCVVSEEKEEYETVTVNRTAVTVPAEKTGAAGPAV